MGSACYTYTASDTDLGDGPYADTVYLAWTDNIGPDSFSPQANHGRIQVAYSRDAGDSWEVRTPHPTDDANSVDRYHPWIGVTDDGIVHVIYYDSTGDPTRESVNIYYSFSVDGGNTWGDPERVTTQDSPNIDDSFEFGDYNALDVVGRDVVASWTDNRQEGAGAGDSRDIYAAAGFAIDEDTTFLTLDPQSVDVCVPATVSTQVSARRATQTDPSPVQITTISEANVFSDIRIVRNPIELDSATLLFADVADIDREQVTLVLAAGNNFSRATQLRINISQTEPLAPSLLTPSDATTDALPVARFSWQPQDDVESYRFQLDDDADFLSPEVEVVTANTQLQLPFAMQAGVQYWWRVIASNTCGETVSATRTVMAQPAMCATPNLPIPDGAPGFARDGLALADVGAVQDLAVQVVVDHAFIGDLTATLSHLDSAETITLFERPGKTSELKNDFGCSGDDIYAVLRDGEPFNTDNSCNDDPGAGLDGAFEADDALSTFNGTAIAGDWEIALNDAFTPDAGVLQHWCLLGAVFDTDRFALTVDVVGQGKVQAPEVTFFCPDDCSEPLPAGTMVALTPIAAPGYSFSGFSGDCSGLSCTVNMNASRAVTATFVQDADVLFRDGFESW